MAPFTFLPGKWSNLGVQLTSTYVDSQIQYVSSTVIADAGQPLRVLGVFLAAIGAGFLISAGLSYALSRHLGLFKADADSTMRNVPQV